MKRPDHNSAVAAVCADLLNRTTENRERLLATLKASRK